MKPKSRGRGQSYETEVRTLRRRPRPRPILEVEAKSEAKAKAGTQKRENLFFHNINMTTMTIESRNQGGLPERPIELATHCKNIS